MDKETFAKYFDHTLLKPEAMPDDIRAFCKEAAEIEPYSVCVNSRFVGLARKTLDEAGAKDVKVCSVVGFPLGAMSKEAKAFEAQQAVSEGAEEIDMVIMIGSVKAGCEKMIKADIAGVKETIGNKTLKVILETGLLTDEEVVFAAKCAVQAGADFIKTSTGFGHGGATVHHIELMKQAAAGKAKIKASGGIRDLSTATQMIEAGADRIGASATVSIISEYVAKNG